MQTYQWKSVFTFDSFNTEIFADVNDPTTKKKKFIKNLRIPLTVM